MAVRVWEYAVPIVPLAKVEVIMFIAALFTVIVNDCVAVAPELSVTLTVKVIVLELAGVPDITPLLLRANPVGNVPALIAHV